jgi:5'-nucleotidase
MNILLTNDDGIASEGILKLAEALRAKGKHRVFVIAPDINRSGISHALSILNGPVKLAFLGEDTWSCSGFPAECVIIGLRGALPEQPDIVISGINQGENLGTDLIYSGTAAAARQGSLADIPSIALSLSANDSFCWEMAASWSADHLDELLAYWKKDTFVNVNIPNSRGGPEGIRASWPAAKAYKDTLSVMKTQDGSSFFFLEAGEELRVAETGSDYDVLSRNFVSVSPVYNYPVVIRDLCPDAPDFAAVSWRYSKRE